MKKLKFIVLFTSIALSQIIIAQSSIKEIEYKIEYEFVKTNSPLDSVFDAYIVVNEADCKDLQQISLNNGKKIKNTSLIKDGIKKNGKIKYRLGTLNEVTNDFNAEFEFKKKSKKKGNRKY